MVAALAREPSRSCGAIMPPVSKPAASRHFKILCAAGLPKQWDSGTQRLNALRHEEFDARVPRPARPGARRGRSPSPLIRTFASLSRQPDIKHC
ncbi:hypothetical protein OHS18_15865 [Amycolatopsis sp. NBC_00355]|uniref:hypothetical protein n=1 Tax=Amycolatopsis sp. NBC_00355 TaxID=2975957 RepID=UPI002E25A028